MFKSIRRSDTASSLGLSHVAETKDKPGLKELKIVPAESARAEGTLKVSTKIFRGSRP